MTVTVYRESQTAPTFGEHRPGAGSLWGDPQAAEPTGQGLPHAPCRGGVDPILRIPTAVLQIDEGGTQEMLVGALDLSNLAPHNGLYTRPERGTVSMVRAGFIVLPVGS